MLKELDSSSTSPRDKKMRLKSVPEKNGAPVRPVVLVVDDDPAVREMVGTCLELEGYKTSQASNAVEAFLRAENDSPQAVVLDILLPDQDGFDVCKKLRENPATNRCVILLLSGLDKMDSRIRGLQAGADDYLTKPFDPSELLARLQAHLRRMKNQEEKEKMLERLAGKLADMNQRLQREASTDSLTELYNRRQFWKRFDEEYRRAKRFQRPISLIALDLDRFKSINDEFGHLTGDQVLKAVGKIMRSHLRGIDIAFRYGGEEFAVLLPETPLESAMMVAERLLAAFRELDIPPVPPGRFSFSAGVATAPEHGDSPQTLYGKADEALYQAKAQGRNRIVAVGSLAKA